MKKHCKNKWNRVSETTVEIVRGDKRISCTQLKMKSDLLLIEYIINLRNNYS